jgi:hypothetical protein
MEISAVARVSGVPASALRYYESKGLIRAMARDGGRRHFAPGGQHDIDRRLLAAKADELDRTAKRLLAMSEGLRHAAVCPAPSHAECPSFQRLLKAAAAGMMAPPPQALGRRKTP